tara:strand:- start:481 stop:627 length:147 start_codon:yes stop_codon:yes gene_type:complete
MSSKKTKDGVNIRSRGLVEERDAKKKWEKPNLEDVSGKVMAQPYIRFT